MVVSFCGHRDIVDGEILHARLYQVIEQLICEGATQFYCGNMGAFDRLAARTVRELKKKYPQVRSTMVKAYLEQESEPGMYDDSVWPPLEDVPPRLAIIFRNRWMVEVSDALVAYVEHSWGGASNMRDYAVKKGRRVLDMAEDLLQNNA